MDGNYSNIVQNSKSGFASQWLMLHVLLSKHPPNKTEQSRIQGRPNWFMFNGGRKITSSNLKSRKQFFS